MTGVALMCGMMIGFGLMGLLVVTWIYFSISSRQKKVETEAKAESDKRDLSADELSRLMSLLFKTPGDMPAPKQFQILAIDWWANTWCAKAALLMKPEEVEYIEDFVRTGNHNFLAERDEMLKILRKFKDRRTIMED